MKKGIKYLRFSSHGQSNHSIERQDMLTNLWMKNNDISIIDTFIDEGYSARTFDRPDVKKLFDFIKKHYRQIDYLVVSELTRFSRETSDAINMVKKIQNEYGIRIVSAGRGTIYDCNDSNSFFIMGIEFLLGNTENLKRITDINGGIYTAKINGRYIHGKPPVGYKKTGSGKDAALIIDEDKAPLIRFIYNAFLSDTPIYFIKDQVKQMGLKFTSNSFVQDILSNPIYSGQQLVKAWNQQPGGIFPANHEPIIDLITWSQVQEKIAGKDKPRVTLIDEMPLRGVLHCHCSRMLTGAPSTGRHGKQYHYYKCNTSSSHNNISANKAHSQLHEMLKYLSLPEYLVEAIKEHSTELMDKDLLENKKQLKHYKIDLEKTEQQLHSVQEKYINNQFSFEDYQVWTSTLSQQRLLLNSKVEKLSRSNDDIYFLLNQNLNLLTDMNAIYQTAETPQKQELLRAVFDNKLYYRASIYRTPYIIPIFTHNLNILKEKQLLILEGKAAQNEESRLGGPERSRTAVQTYLP